MSTNTSISKPKPPGIGIRFVNFIQYTSWHPIEWAPASTNHSLQSSSFLMLLQLLITSNQHQKINWPRKEPSMATKIPAPAAAAAPAGQIRKRAYTACKRNWICGKASQIPVASSFTASCPASVAAVPFTSGQSATTATAATVKKRFAFRRNGGNVKVPPTGSGGQEKGKNAAGPGVCDAVFGSVKTHLAKFEEMASPPANVSPQARKVPVKTYWIRAGLKEDETKQENKPPTTVFKATLQVPGRRVALIKRDVSAQGSIGRRIRPALAGLFDTAPAVTLQQGNNSAANFLQHNDSEPANSRTGVTMGSALLVPGSLTAPQHKRSNSNTERTREQEVLRRLEKAHLTTPVFRCAGPRSTNDYSQGPLTVTYFGDLEEDEEAECLQRAGIREWVKGTWRSLRLTSGGGYEETKVLEPPRGWLEEGE